MRKITLIILLIILGIAAVFYINLVNKNKYQHEVELGTRPDRVFDDYANEWIEEQESETNKTIKINVREATQGNADFVLGHERYIDEDGEIIALFYDGAYEGNIFSGTYVDGDYNDFTDDQIKMRIWSEMNPTDGVIEGFALTRKENDAFVFYLFIDEDWAKRADYKMQIIWGPDIKDKENLHHRAYDFSREENGVYIDKVTEDVDWFHTQDPVIGRLFFGEITYEQIKNSDYSSTFIALT